MYSTLHHCKKTVRFKTFLVCNYYLLLYSILIKSLKNIFFRPFFFYMVQRVETMIYYFICHPLGFYIRPDVLGVTLLQQIFYKPSQYTLISIGVDKTIWFVFSLCDRSRCTCRSPFLPIAEYFCNYFCFFVSSLRQ